MIGIYINRFFYHILRILVDSKINAADIFSRKTKHQHDHSGTEQNGYKNGTVAYKDMRMYQFPDDSNHAVNKSENSDH